MHKLVAVMLLSFSLSAASTETSKESSESSESKNVFGEIFNVQSYVCDEFPLCNGNEESQMARETELEKEVYESPEEEQRKE